LAALVGDAEGGQHPPNFAGVGIYDFPHQDFGADADGLADFHEGSLAGEARSGLNTTRVEAEIELARACFARFSKM
jgi:hypothetical protein